MTTVPGLNMPTQTAMLAGNPRDSAIAAQTNTNDKLAALNKAVGGADADVDVTQGGYRRGGSSIWSDLRGTPIAINKPVTLWTGRRYRSRQQVHTTRRHRRKPKHVYTRKQTRKRCGRKRCRCRCPCKVCRTMCMYRERRGGAGAGADTTATVQVPQFTMQYTPTGGPGQTPNDLIKQNSQISTQSAANSVYDKYAAQK